MEESAPISYTTSPGPHLKEPSLGQIQWFAPISLLIAFACIAASATIIICSDKQTVASWNVQPTILLAILSSVFAFSLGAAFSVGIAITWQQSMLRGTSVERLFYTSTRGGGLRFIRALTAGPDARKVVLVAAIVAIVKFANNPMLQRATRIRAEDIVTSEAIMMNITQRLPDGWMGTILNASYASPDSVQGSRAALSTAQEWWRNGTITSLDAPGYYCNGTCEGNVPGAGIGFTCSSTTQPLDLTTGRGTVIFAINTTMAQNSTGPPFLLLTTLYSSAVDDSCIATLTIDTCIIEAGVVEYPITIQNSTITLNYDELSNVTVLSTYVYPGDLPTATPGALAGTLQGLNDFYGYYLYATTNLDNPTSYSGGSMLADMFFDADSSSYDNYTYSTCGLKWSSPTKYVLNSMQDFMFRAALHASNGTQVQFTAQRINLALLFHSEYGYLAAAVAVMLLALFAVLFLLLGWWKFRRTASLNPFETAKVFGAPVMQIGGYRFTTNEILKAIGRIGVQYRDGVVVYYNSDVTDQATERQPKDEEHGPETEREAGQARRSGEGGPIEQQHRDEEQMHGPETEPEVFLVRRSGEGRASGLVTEQQPKDKEQTHGSEAKPGLPGPEE